MAEKIYSLSDKITVCICTFKRPKYLLRLLNKLEEQDIGRLFDYSIVIVDNDCNQTGKPVVTEFEKNSRIKVIYCSEPERSISLARNKAIKNADGNLIAFIDDDEFPINTWLLNLYQIYTEYKTDGVLGPVQAHFETEPPAWLIKSRLLERKSFKTGEIIHSAKYTRTGNVLLRKELFCIEQDYFDPFFGLIGGGDAEFFKRMLDKNRIFVWCNEALVYETVPPDRQKVSYYLKRAFTRGIGEIKHESIWRINTLKSLVAIIIYAFLLPFLLFVGPYLFIRYLVKMCDHLGKILAFVGIKPVKARPYS